MKRSTKVLYGAVIYSLFMGLVCTGFAFFGLFMRWCWLSSHTSPLSYMFYLVYYRVSSCEAVFKWKKFNILNYVDVTLPEETDSSRRTYVLTLIYLVLQLALTAASLLALYAIRCVVNKNTRKYHFIPLVVMLIVTVVYDVIATVFYVIDFINITKTDGLMNILEVINQNETRPNFDQLPYMMRYASPIIMFCVTSKIFFFLIANIVWAVTIVQMSFSEHQDTTDDEDSDTVEKTNYKDAIIANDNPAFEDEKIEVKSPSHDSILSKEYDGVSEKRYNDTARVKDFVYPHQLSAKSKKKCVDDIFDADSLDFKIQRPTLTASYYGNSRKSKLQSFPDSADNEERIKRFHKSKETLGSDNFSSDLSYKDLRPTPPPKPNRQEVHQRPNTTYYLRSTGHEINIMYRPNSGMSDLRSDRSSGHIKTPQELRSQLPWSYFNNSDEVPRHALVHVDESDIPGTPLPDYDNSVKQRRHIDKSDDY